MTPVVWRFAVIAVVLALGGVSQAWAGSMGQSPDQVVMPAADAPAAEAATGTSITVSARGATAAAQSAGMAIEEEDETFKPNHPLKDFEVHVLVALPFTALYSYVGMLTLDTLVQGTYPPVFRDMNTVAVIGFAAGAALAVALGSSGRVPDQSRPLLQNQQPEPVGPPVTHDPKAMEVDVVRLTY